jgi:hypothetical protein
MNTTTKDGQTVLVLENGRGGGVIAAPPHVLAGICRGLGFRNSCADGRLFLTATKMAAIGLGAAPGEMPSWRSLGTDELWTISQAVR